MLHHVPATFQPLVPAAITRTVHQVNTTSLFQPSHCNTKAAFNELPHKKTITKHSHTHTNCCACVCVSEVGFWVCFCRSVLSWMFILVYIYVCVCVCQCKCCRDFLFSFLGIVSFNNNILETIFFTLCTGLCWLGRSNKLVCLYFRIPSSL